MRPPGKASRTFRRSCPNVSGGGQVCGAVCSHTRRTRLATPSATNEAAAHGQSRRSIRAKPTMASVPPGRTSVLRRCRATLLSGR